MATGYITMPYLSFPRATPGSTFKSYHVSANFCENSPSTVVLSSSIFSVLKAVLGLGYTVQNKYSSLNLAPGTGNQNRTE